VQGSHVKIRSRKSTAGAGLVKNLQAELFHYTHPLPLPILLGERDSGRVRATAVADASNAIILARVLKPQLFGHFSLIAVNWFQGSALEPNE
jgi:hypothetical protein